MEIRVLKYFLMVAREENITKAANLLHITQPTLSRQLIQLEEELGTTLFHRSKYRIVLTEDGMLLKRRAQEIIELADKAKKELEEKRKEAKILQQKYEQRHQKRVDRKLAQFKEYQRKNHESVDKMKSLYARGDKKQIINYFNAVLANDDFTLDILYRQERYDSASMISEYDEKTKTLSYRYRIPSSDEICVIDRFVYDGESGEVVAKELDKTHAKRVRMHLLQTLLLRSVARIICSDESKNIEFINLTGFLRYYDRAYGNNREINVVKLKIGRDILLQINPERANISELFERTLKGKFKTSAGLYDKEPFCLTEIK